MRNAGSSGVSAEGLCIKVGSTLSLIPGFVFSCGGLLSSFFLCRLLSSGGRVQLSYCGKGLPSSCIVHGVL